MINYRENDIECLVDLEDELEAMGGNKVTEKEVWLVARESEEVPEFENIYISLVYQEIDRLMEDKFPSIEVDNEVNCAASGYLVNGECGDSLDDIKTQVALALIEGGIKRFMDYEEVLEYLAIEDEDAFDVNDCIDINKLSFTDGEEVWTTQLQEAYGDAVTSELTRLIKQHFGEDLKLLMVETAEYGDLTLMDGNGDEHVVNDIDSFKALLEELDLEAHAFDDGPSR